jgi:hypothetical protein
VASRLNVWKTKPDNVKVSKKKNKESFSFSLCDYEDDAHGKDATSRRIEKWRGGYDKKVFGQYQFF